MSVGQAAPDEADVDAADLNAARDVAGKLAGDLMRDASTGFWSTGEIAINVSDASGLSLFTLTVFAFDAPALLR